MAQTDEEILEAIRAEATAMAPHLDPARLRPEAHIAEVGINSVQMLELVARLEERFDVTMSDDELSGVESVADLTRLVIRAQAEVT